MKYTVTGNFTRINSSGGTVQNISSQMIEISNTNVLGSGFLLRPLESISFSGNIYARCPAGNKAEMRVVPFGASSSSGSSSSDTTSSGSDFDDDINDMWNTDSTDSSEYDSDINNLWDNP